MFKGEATGRIEVGVEGRHQFSPPRGRSYKGVTSDRVRDPISVCLCSRGWVMGRGRSRPHQGADVIGGNVLEGEGLDPGVAVLVVGLVAFGSRELGHGGAFRWEEVEEESCMVGT